MTQGYKAFALIGIDDDQSKPASAHSRQGRGLSFHSLRHYCNAMLRGVIGDEKLRRLTGHSSVEMTNHYDHVTDLDVVKVRQAQAEIILGENQGAD